MVETVKSFTDEGNKERCVKALTDIHRQVQIMMSVAVGVQRLKRRRSAFDVLPRLATAGGGAELSFAIDCGAKIPFSLTLGRLGSLAVTATEPQIRSGEGMVTTKSR